MKIRSLVVVPCTALLSALALTLWSAPSALAQQGQSTPGVSLAAVNPGSPAGGGLLLALTAHSAQSTVANPSCRPQDLTLRCSGSLVLRDATRGGFSVIGFDVHRIAVGDISCGGEDSCGSGEPAVSSPVSGPGEQIQVNGVATVTNPGSLASAGVSAGTQVQLQMRFTDNGTAPYADRVDIVVNKFVSGPKPLLFETGNQPLQQLLVHVQDAAR